MEDWIAYAGGAVVAAVLGFGISMVGFGMDVQAALTPALVAAAVALVVVYITD